MLEGPSIYCTTHPPPRPAQLAAHRILVVRERSAGSAAGRASGSVASLPRRAATPASPRASRPPPRQRGTRQTGCPCGSPRTARSAPRRRKGRSRRPAPGGARLVPHLRSVESSEGSAPWVVWWSAGSQLGDTLARSEARHVDRPSGAAVGVWPRAVREQSLGGV